MQVCLRRLCLLMMAVPAKLCKHTRLSPSLSQMTLSTDISTRKNNGLNFCFCHKYCVNLWAWQHKSRFQRSLEQILFCVIGSSRNEVDKFPRSHQTTSSEEISHQDFLPFSFPSLTLQPTPINHLLCLGNLIQAFQTAGPMHKELWLVE